MTGSGDPPASGMACRSTLMTGRWRSRPEPVSGGVPQPPVAGTDASRTFPRPGVRSPAARSPARPPAPVPERLSRRSRTGRPNPPTDGDAIPVHRPYPGDRPPNFPPPGVRRPAVPAGPTQLPSGAKPAPVVMSGELPSKPQAPKVSGHPTMDLLSNFTVRGERWTEAGVLHQRVTGVLDGTIPSRDIDSIFHDMLKHYRTMATGSGATSVQIHLENNIGQFNFAAIEQAVKDAGGTAHNVPSARRIDIDIPVRTNPYR